jgi:hypothetical protein
VSVRAKQYGNLSQAVQQLTKGITQRVWAHMRVIAGTVYLLALAVWCGIEDLFSSSRIQRSYKTP